MSTSYTAKFKGGEMDGKWWIRPLENGRPVAEIFFPDSLPPVVDYDEARALAERTRPQPLSGWRYRLVGPDPESPGGDVWIYKWEGEVVPVKGRT